MKKTVQSERRGPLPPAESRGVGEGRLPETAAGPGLIFVSKILNGLSAGEIFFSQIGHVRYLKDQTCYADTDTKNAITLK
jgi:hypothetical protein